MLPVNQNNMAISDFFNPVKAVQKVSGKISDYFAPTVYSKQETPSPSRYSLADRGVDLTDQDFEAIRPLIYGEISNRTPDKQELETHVILNTALNRMREYANRGQKRTLSDVIAMPNQYQAYGGEQYRLYSNPPDIVAQKKREQVDAMVDRIREQIKSGVYPDNTEGAFYYIHNPDGTITYDNKKPLFANK